jgi:toxin ParE1/3/4
VADLQGIFEFYAQQSTQLAERIVERIVDRVDVLKLGFLEIGQLEPLLVDHPGKPRYLVEGNHKIIYRILNSTDVLILMVFDVRQDPRQLQRRF